MSVTIRQIEPSRNLCAQVRLDALAKAIPLSVVENALAVTHTKTQRERKLNLIVTVFLVIAMNLFTGDSIGYVFERLCMGLRLLEFVNLCQKKSGRTPKISLPKVPGDSALVYRRYQLGVRPLVALFRAICRPMAEPITAPGAFLFGLRLMGIDGQVMTAPDTPQNTAYFGRMGNGHGGSAYPKVKGVYLCELGTHGIIDVGFWPCRISEEVAAYRLLRSIHEGMLVLFDRGLWAAQRVIAIRKCGAHVLCRLPSTVKPVLHRPLSDGTRLVWISPSSSANKSSKDRERLLVRLIEYKIDDPAMPGYGETYRMITTLLDPEQYPALEIAAAYHERWEIELTFDEIEVHQRHLPCGPLRSLKPVGVLQELYGMLIAHWVIRSLMYQAAERAGLDPDRLSFVRALRIVRDMTPYFQTWDPATWPFLHEIMLAKIAERPLPPRRSRSNPRVVKRQQSKFPVKKKEHRGRPSLPRPFGQDFVLI